VDRDFLNWFVGFTDGEGCFLIRNTRKKHYTDFIIHLRADDIAILEEIRTRLGFGSVAVENRQYHYDRYDRQFPMGYFKVCKIKDCQRLVALFDHFPLRAKKKADYEIWREAVRENRKPMHRRNQLYLSFLKQELSKAKKGNR